MSTARKAFNLTTVCANLAKLSLVPAHIVEQEIAAAKKQKLDDKEIELLKNQAILCFDGQPLSELQLGIVRDENPQPLSCWSALAYCVKESNGAFKFLKVMSNKDTEFTASQPVSANARNKNSRMGKLQCSVQLNESEEGQLALAFLKRYEELVMDAAIHGMKLPDGTTFFAPKVGDDYSKMSIDLAKSMIRKKLCTPLNIPTTVNAKTQKPYSPDVKLKVRWFYDPDKTNMLTTPLVIVEPPVPDPVDPKKKIPNPNTVSDPIAYLAQAVTGAWIVTFDNVNLAGTGGQIWMSLKLEKAMLQIIPRKDGSSTSSDFYN